jgi:hypothetical protein
MNLLTLSEYEKPVLGVHKELYKVLDGCSPDLESDTPDKEIASRLGCSQQSGGVWAGGWSGVVRYNSIAFAVLPRMVENRTQDLVAMYATCLSDPIVASHMGEPAVFFWPEQQAIECPDELKEQGLLFLVMAYLQELHQLCLRHLRNKFVHVTENLNGRTKGKLDIARQVRTNLSRGRADRTVCDFTIHSNNCRENQILKTALERGARVLTRYNLNNIALWSKVRFCRHELGNVEEVDVTPRLFQGLRYTGLFRPYRKAHELAKCILNLLPPDPHSSRNNLSSKVPPFAICTYELFERYCEVKLRVQLGATGGNELWVGYQNGTPGGNGRLRPDFLICAEGKNSERWIIDAKNKPNWSGRLGTSEWESDVPQLCRYSRFLPILKELGYEQDEQSSASPNMLVVYPGNSDGMKNFPTLDEQPGTVIKVSGFSNLWAVAIQVPLTEPK